MHFMLRIGTALAVVALTGASAMAGDCEPHWDVTLANPGPNNQVHSLALFDDGNGPALYAGGSFSSAAGIPGTNAIARWDGESWSSVGGGMTSGAAVFALFVWDDGNGPALYAGGQFTVMGGVATQNMARWTGQEWENFGDASFIIRNFTSWDDGTGDALYIFGQFQQIGGIDAERIAKFDGENFFEVGGGLPPTTRVGYVWDDGDGEALYVGGPFTVAGGKTVNRIVKWDGEEWHALGGGITAGTSFVVLAIASFDGALYVAGTFTEVDGTPMNRIAKWDGESWSDLAGGANGTVNALIPFDDGEGTRLYVAGAFTEVGVGPGSMLAGRFAAWDGQQWHPMIGGGVGSSSVIRMIEDKTGQGLYVGGNFFTVGGGGGGEWLTSNHITHWVGCAEPDVPACPADLTGSGNVGVPDLLALLACWGPVEPGCESADLTQSGSIGVPDLLELLSEWGECP